MINLVGAAMHCVRPRCLFSARAGVEIAAARPAGHAAGIARVKRNVRCAQLGLGSRTHFILGFGLGMYFIEHSDQLGLVMV